MTTVPDIPASAAHRPTVGGLVVPWVNPRLRDGGVDFRTAHNSRYRRCWTELRCQTCGRLLPPWAIIFGGPRQLRTLRFDEPPLCPPCALYASKACPMVAGRQTHYADRETLTEGRRGQACSRGGCDCGGWVGTDPNARRTGGEPAHPWFASWVSPRTLTLTVHEVEKPCTDARCPVVAHRTMEHNGCFLPEPPRKIMLVSAPGRGRVWERVTYEQAIA